MKSKTLDSNASTDNLSRQQLETFRELWLAGTGVTPDDPRINLLHADLTGLPPTMIFYGTGEILVGEITEFVQRAKHAGVDISLHTVPEGQHSFIMGAGHVPEADEAIELMGHWVRSRLKLARRSAAESRAITGGSRPHRSTRLVPQRSTVAAGLA
jgi:acetyl esterase/lipase